MISSNNTSIYYPSNDAMIYPSSNSNDGGEDNSEINLKTITDKLAIKSFVIKRKDGRSDDYFKLSCSNDPVGVSISSGECSINGYYFNLGSVTIPTTYTVDVSDKKETKNYLSGGDYVVFLQIFKDGVGHIRGDGPSSTDVFAFECKGVKACIGTQSYLDSLDKSLILPIGYFTTSDGNPPTSDEGYTLYDTRFSFIDLGVVINSSGDATVEDWVNGRILHDTTCLNQINYYPDQDSNSLGKPKNNPTSTLKLTENRGELIFTGYGTKIIPINTGYTETSGDLDFNIVDIENRTQVALPEETTAPWEDSISNIGQGSTTNGVSKLLARADHSHDSRYLKLSPASSSPQEITGSLKLSGDIETSTGFKYVPKFLGGALEGSLYPAWTIDYKGLKVISPKGTGISLLVGSYVSHNASPSAPYEEMDITLEGHFTATQFITPNSNDYAELYRKYSRLDTSDEGTVICKVRGLDEYRPSTYSDRSLVVGIVTESYGHIVGGDEDKSFEENLKTHYAVSLVGRVKVKVVPGIVIHEGDLLSASDCGRAEVAQESSQGCIIGKALESSDGSKDKILVQVMLK